MGIPSSLSRTRRCWFGPWVCSRCRFIFLFPYYTRVRDRFWIGFRNECSVMPLPRVGCRDHCMAYLSIPPTLQISGVRRLCFWYVLAHPKCRGNSPFMNKCTNITVALVVYSGKRHQKIYQLHQKYGTIVRIGVCFCDDTPAKQVIWQPSSALHQLLTHYPSIQMQRLLLSTVHLAPSQRVMHTFLQVSKAMASSSSSRGRSTMFAVDSGRLHSHREQLHHTSRLLKLEQLNLCKFFLNVGIIKMVVSTWDRQFIIGRTISWVIWHLVVQTVWWVDWLPKSSFCLHVDLMNDRL